MTHTEFINQTIEMVKQCQCDDFHHGMFFKAINKYQIDIFSGCGVLHFYMWLISVRLYNITVIDM